MITINILSIDFDYFQNVVLSDLYAYPDGIDNNTALSEIIWGGIYGGVSGEAIEQITIRKTELNAAKRLIRKQKRNIPVMITNSHKHIYDFIHEYADVNEPLRLVNVDMHHDMFNDGLELDDPVLDCGNWVSFIIKEYKTDFTWIANPVSSKMYGLGHIETKNAIDKLISTSLKHIKDMQFDAIFLCRSDTWTPPHLDCYFTELCTCMLDHFGEIYAEKNITNSRTEYKSIAEQTKAIRLKITSEHKN